MTDLTPAPASAERMVLVPAELLVSAERVLNDPYSQTATMGWVLRDLLAAPQPAPAPAGLIEHISARVHDEWMEAKRRSGVTSRRLETGEELMVPYVQLSEEAKELDRVSVRAVLSHLPPHLLAHPTPPAGAGALRQWRHVKTGGLYTELEVATVEATGEPVVVYRGQDGRVWTRPAAEFMDGRFVALPAQAQAEGGSQ